MQSPVDQNSRFSKWLRRELEDGFSVDPKISDYLNTTFGHDDLAHILATAESGDCDTLTDLLFFPDEKLRFRYEMQWGGVTFSEADVNAILNHLVERPPQVVMRTDLNGPQIRLAMPDFSAETLLQRLHLIWRPARKLKTVLKSIPSESRRAEVRLYLRGAHLAWHPGQVEAVALCLTRMPPSTDDFLETLTFLLSIIAELPAGQAAEALLIDRKRAFFQAWCKAEEFERRRLASNMEILMLQGERATHGTPQHWRAQMARIDRLSRILFNRIEYIHVPFEERLDPGSVGTSSNLDSLSGLLM
jgi:hypothetical protein